MILFSYEPGHDLHPCLIRWKVVKETPCGYWMIREEWEHHLEDWVLPFWVQKKWTSKNGKKRLAYPEKDQAFQSYLIKSKRYVEHCERRLETAKARLYEAKNFTSNS